MKFFQPTTAPIYSRVLCPGSWSPRQFEFHLSDPSLAVFGTIDGVLCVADVQNPSHRGLKTLRMDESSPVLGLCWSRRTRSLLAAGTGNGTVNLYDIGDPRDEWSDIELKVSFDKIPQANLRQLTSVHFNSDDSRLVTSGNSHSVYVYDPLTGKEVRRLENIHTGDINITRFAFHNPSIFCTTSFDKTCAVWDLRQAREIYRLKCAQPVIMAYFSDDDRYILSSSLDNEITQWHTADGKQHLSYDVPRMAHGQNFSRAYYMNGGDVMVCGASEQRSLFFFNAYTGDALGSYELYAGRKDDGLYVQSLRGYPHKDGVCAGLVSYRDKSYPHEIVMLDFNKNEHGVDDQELGHTIFTPPGIRYIEQLSTLLETGQDSDLTFLCDRSRFAVHRAIIDARCPALLQLATPESPTTMSVASISPRCLRLALKFIYTGGLAWPDDAALESLSTSRCKQNSFLKFSLHEEEEEEEEEADVVADSPAHTEFPLLEMAPLLDAEEVTFLIELRDCALRLKLSRLVLLIDSTLVNGLNSRNVLLIAQYCLSHQDELNNKLMLATFRCLTQNLEVVMRFDGIQCLPRGIVDAVTTHRRACCLPVHTSSGKLIAPPSLWPRSSSETPEPHDLEPHDHRSACSLQALLEEALHCKEEERLRAHTPAPDSEKVAALQQEFTGLSESGNVSMDVLQMLKEQTSVPEEIFLDDTIRQKGLLTDCQFVPGVMRRNVGVARDDLFSVHTMIPIAGNRVITLFGANARSYLNCRNILSFHIPSRTWSKTRACGDFPVGSGQNYGCDALTPGFSPHSIFSRPRLSTHSSLIYPTKEDPDPRKRSDSVDYSGEAHCPETLTSRIVCLLPWKTNRSYELFVLETETMRWVKLPLECPPDCLARGFTFNRAGGEWTVKETAQSGIVNVVYFVIAKGSYNAVQIDCEGLERFSNPSATADEQFTPPLFSAKDCLYRATWKKLALRTPSGMASPPPSVSHHSAVVLNLPHAWGGRMVTYFGGFSHVGPTSALFALRLDSRSTLCLPCVDAILERFNPSGIPPSERYFCSCCTVGSTGCSLAVYGGFPSRGEPLKDLHLFTVTGRGDDNRMEGQWSTPRTVKPLPSITGPAIIDISSSESTRHSLLIFGGELNRSFVGDAPPDITPTLLDVELSDTTLEWKEAHTRALIAGPEAVVLVPPLRLHLDLLKMLNNPSTADIKLQAGDASFLAHRFFLASRSPHFAAMFRVNMKECQDGVVSLPDDLDPEMFECLLHHLYADVAKGIPETAMELIALSGEFALDNLRQLCERSLLRFFTADSIAVVLQFAANYFCEGLCGMFGSLIFADLKDHAIRFCLDKFEAVSSSSAFKELCESGDTEFLAVVEELKRRYFEETHAFSLDENAFSINETDEFIDQHALEPSEPAPSRGWFS